jgi:hypothetical protein
MDMNKSLIIMSILGILLVGLVSAEWWNPFSWGESEDIKQIADSKSNSIVLKTTRVTGQEWKIYVTGNESKWVDMEKTKIYDYKDENNVTHTKLKVIERELKDRTYRVCLEYNNASYSYDECSISKKGKDIGKEVCKEIVKYYIDYDNCTKDKEIVYSAPVKLPFFDIEHSS